MAVTFEDLQKKQEEMTALAEQLVGEEDCDRILAIAEELKGHGAELERMGNEFTEANPSTFLGSTEVVLTPEQRQRIHDETGIEMASLWLRDEAGALMTSMPHTDPRVIEYRALEEARRRKAATEADALLQAELAEVLGTLEGVSPEVAAQLEILKQNPHFLGGLLQKK